MPGWSCAIVTAPGSMRIRYVPCSVSRSKLTGSQLISGWTGPSRSYGRNGVVWALTTLRPAGGSRHA